MGSRISPVATSVAFAVGSLLTRADEPPGPPKKALATVHQGCVFALTGKASNAV
jgi:hypothetical protein